MGTGQGPIKIQSGNALDVGETTSNVATNKAELAALAANIDGKDTYPQSVSTQRLQVAQTLSIGDQVQLTDGCVKSNHLTTDSAVITDSLQIGNNVITEDAINVPNLSSLNANLGTITGGSLSIGSGGVTVSGGSGGVYIGDNQIFLGTAGSPTVLLDGSTGIIYASKFQMTADEDSTLDMSLGSLTIGGGTSVDGTTTIGDIASDASQAASDAAAALSAAAAAQDTADGEIVGYYQTTEPTSGMKFGDIWIDTNYAGFPTTSAIFRYQDVDGGSTGALAWRSAPNNAIGKVYLNAYTANVNAGVAQSTANSKITTFYQTSAPTALATGDLWIETDNGNKLWRWSGSSWVSVRDAGATAGATAVQPGGGVAVDGNKYITTIDMSSGLVIRTSSSTAKTQITANGMAVYNSSGTITVQIDHSNGVYVNNIGHTTNPEQVERYSVAYNGTQHGYVAAYDYGLLVKADGTNKQLLLHAPLNVNVNAISGSINMTAAQQIAFTVNSKVPLMIYDDSFSVKGDITVGSSSASCTLEVWNKLSVRGTGACVQIAGGPAIYASNGSPNGSLSAYKGSICMDYTNGKLYVNTNGSTTWVVAGTQT